MSLRDFNTSSDDRPLILNNEPLGNGAGLASFHTVNPEMREPNNMPKIGAAVAVALMVGAAGAYIYSVNAKIGSKPSVVTAANLPQTAPAPMPQPAAVPPAPMPQPTATTVEEPKTIAPVKTAAKPGRSRVAAASSADSAASDAASARMAADSTQVNPQPQQQAIVSEPVSPQAPASSLASTQSGSSAAVPTTATTASDMPPQAPAQPEAQPMEAAPQQ